VRAVPSALSTSSTLYGVGVALLPAACVFAEFYFRFHPFVQLAFVYLLLVFTWAAAREARLVQLPRLPVTSERADLAGHLLLLALFALVLFGAQNVLLALATGHWGLRALPVHGDVLLYGVSLALWLALYNVAGRLPTVYEFNLRLRLSWWDVPIALGIALPTFYILRLYLIELGDNHERMHVFGVDQASSPAWVFYGAGLLFTVSNALIEELWWRGTLLAALRPLLPPAGVILLQGLCFGILHWFGTPMGIAGLLLAGTWGLALGWWVYARRSLWQPLAIHLLADWLIFAYTNG
jgi:membrane protease YdiL (CAAX protease family)